MKASSLILASASPRRRDLLNLAGVKFDVKPSQVDELVQPGESSREHVLRLARLKADWCAKHHPQAWVLAADTVVVIADCIMGKPKNTREAREMLKRLSGRTHQVLTGYCLMNEHLNRIDIDHAVTEVEFRRLSLQDIENYVRSGEAIGKAGAYAIQGRGAGLVRRISGSYTNVVGLPLAETIELLQRYDLIP